MATRKSAAPVDGKAAVEQNPASAVFSKNKMLTLKRYANRRDILSALLEEDQSYTLGQVDNLLQDFMRKGKVN